MDKAAQISEENIKSAEELGLLKEEYIKIVQLLGREPNFTELSIYSVMWSEHCSYKNSILWLKKLPKKGNHILAEAGEENAGLVDIGDGLACAFKIESHNHPSAIEPYQGAATGVGGINRDIFTMGARPIAQLNSLRFGSLEQKRAKWHLEGVVKGIGDYGNAFGVPVLSGETQFDDRYLVNPLVNAMSVGIVEIGKTMSAISYGEGNPVYIVGALTGKDGIHGAAFASKDITESSADDLPAVQVGDPFQEKLLLEATLELAETDAVVGMQDMGAAGIICSSSEMSEKGEHGMDIDLDKVPTRQEGMKDWEMLLSESQERMLVVVHKDKTKKVEEIFEKWDLKCVQIGTVTKGNTLNFFMGGKKVVELPADSLVLGGGAPVYEREYKEPAYFKARQKFSIDDVPQPKDLKEVAKFLINQPNIASKEWITNQYDSMVGTVNMSTNKITDAGIANLKGSKKALALTVDCNGRYVEADPEKGTEMAVAEAARNITCSGGVPSAISNCLNFGNPYNPEVYWQFVGAIKGMSKACEKFNTPVTGGNVSFYNQSEKDGKTIPVYPTPVIGMLGFIEDKKHITSLAFPQSGDFIYMLGEAKNDINCSEYLYAYHKIKESPAPSFDLEQEFDTQEFLRKIIRLGIVSSAHDCADGGLFVTLLESAMVNDLGFEIETDKEIRKDAFLFGEAQGRIVISIDKKNNEAFLKEMKSQQISYSLLGKTSSGSISIDDEKWGVVSDLKSIYDEAINKKVTQ